MYVTCYRMSLTRTVMMLVWARNSETKFKFMSAEVILVQNSKLSLTCNSRRMFWKFLIRYVFGVCGASRPNSKNNVCILRRKRCRSHLFKFYTARVFRWEREKTSRVRRGILRKAAGSCGVFYWKEPEPALWRSLTITHSLWKTFDVIKNDAAHNNKKHP